MTRWEHEEVLDAAQDTPESEPGCMMRIRRTTVEHPFGTLESVDGIDPLPHQNARQGEYRDESARVGVQHEANDEYYGYKISHRGDRGIKKPLLMTKYRTLGQSQFLLSPETIPRPDHPNQNSLTQSQRQGI